jgi:predicted RNase H-like HicB family nuclease
VADLVQLAGVFKSRGAFSPGGAPGTYLTLDLANWRIFCTIVTGGVEMTQQILTAILHKEEDLYIAECPEVGTVSQGYTVEEAVANLKEATELYLEEFPLPEITRPLLTTFEVAVYA